MSTYPAIAFIVEEDGRTSDAVAEVSGDTTPEEALGALGAMLNGIEADIEITMKYEEGQ